MLNLHFYIDCQLLVIANLLLQMENKLVVASLRFHQPEIIYDFLQKNVGPLFMTIKVGRALLNFPKTGNAETAITKYHNYTLRGMPLRLAPYREGILDVPLPPPEPEPQPIIPQKAPQQLIEQKPVEEQGPQVVLSEFTRLIEESLQIVEPQNLAEDITKKNRRQIMEFVNSYAPLLTAATLKQNEIASKYADSQEKAKKLEEFYGYYKLGLKNIMQMLKKEFRILKRCCAKYGQQQENIDIQPSINIARVSQKDIEKVTAFKNHMQYMSHDSLEVKRIAALNQQQIVVTTHRRQGRLAFYKLEDEYVQTACDIKQGAYGLSLLDRHILVGTYQGNIAFFDINNLSVQETSQRLHNSLIFEVVRYDRRADGYNVITLGGDSFLKIWNVKHEKYTETQSTLFFEQCMSLEGDYKINSVDVIDPFKIAYGKQKSIVLFDCTTKQPIATQATKGIAMKVAKIDEQFIGVANQRYLSFVDMRNNAKTMNFDLAKQIKTLAPLSQYTVFYGCMDGEVGVIDRRITTKNYWRTGAIHKGRIYDICKIGEKVVTGDHTGQLATWLPLENYSRNGIVGEYK